jgi:hypothetical protein
LNKQDIAKTQGIAYPQRQSKEPLKKRLLTVNEAASYIGRTIEATKKLYYKNHFPIVKADGRVFIDIQDLDRWIEQSKIRYTY